MAGRGLSPFARGSGFTLRSGMRLPSAPAPYNPPNEKEQSEEAHSSSQMPGGERIQRTPEDNKAPSVTSESKSKPMSSQSHRSIKIRTQEVDFNLEEELSKLKEQEIDLETAMLKINVEIECCKDLLEELQSKLPGLEDLEEEECCKRDITTIQKDLQKALKQKKIQVIEEKGLRDKINTRKVILQKQANLAKDKIIEDNEQVLSSDDEDGVEKGDLDLGNITSQDRVTAFVKETSEVMGREQIKLLIEDEQKEKEKIEEDELEKVKAELEKVKLIAAKAAAEAATEAELSQQASKRQQVADQAAAKALQDQICLEEKLRNRIKADSHSVQHIKPNENIEQQAAVNSGVEQLALALTQAISRIGSQSSNPTSDNSKFLARQSYTKVLPKFSGSPEDWPIFISDFERSTKDCGFSHSENMGRLRKCLEGEAYKYVQSMMVSPDNVPQIMKDLEERYGQPEHIIRVMINKAKDVKLVSSDNLESLVEFGAAVRNFTATVKTLKRPEHLSNPQLQYELENKLPTSLRMEYMQWVMEDTSRKADLEHFSEWLGKKTAIACRICPIQLSQEKKEESTQAKGSQDKQADPKHKGLKKGKKKEIRVEGHDTEDAPTAMGLAAAGFKPRQCIFCEKDNHASPKCFKAKNMTSEERSEAVRQKNACFRCLKRGHISKFCNASITCEKCGGRHETIMCRQEEPEHKLEVSWEYKDSLLEQELGKPKLTGLSVNHHNNWTRRKVTMLKVLVVKAVGPKGSSTVRMLIDEGSQASYIGSRTVNRIGCRSLGVEVVKNCLLGGYVTKWQQEHLREVTITNLAGTVSKTWTLREKPIVCTSLPKIAAGPWLEPLKEKNVLFTDLEGAPVDEEDIEILIGSDLREFLMAKGEVTLEEGVVARETIFGWALGGSVESCKGTFNNANMVISMFQERQHCLEDLWSLDLLGIKEAIQTKTKVQEEEEAKKHFRDNVTRKEDGRYSVALPFIHEKPDLPSNLSIAKKRLITTTKKLFDKQVIEIYDSIFRKWEEEGIVETVQVDISNAGHYLPHHPVFKPDSKTTPVRPVFDASCKSFDNPSLNNCLYTGPNLIELIPAVLNRFRERRLGVVSDIRKAFQMIEVREEDRDYQRFLWWEAGDKDNLQTYRHARVVFGITCSPYLLGAVLDLHLNQVPKEEKVVALKLLKSMYVDNSIVSFDNTEEYEEFRTISTRVLAQAGMELREWQCSGGEVSGIGLSRTSEGCGLETDAVPVDFLTPVLGLTWDRNEDTLSCELSSIDLQAPWTKRKLLSVVARVFDPIGYTSPAILSPKIMVQEMWKANKNWDDELEDGIVADFIKWYGEVHQLSAIKIPRQMVHFVEQEEVQLHLFTDACSYAYAAVVFIRSLKGADVNVQLVQARSRVAPVKGATIPRLELMGCLIGARLLKFVRDSLDFSVKKEFCWTDSTTALAWIQRNEEWGTFVANRVKEIRKLTSIQDWRHVAGTLNPADLPSRGCSPSQLLESKWWEGVPWIKCPEQEWPQLSNDVNEEEVCKEIKGQKKINLHVERKEPWFVCKFSCFRKVVKVMAWILRFFANVKINKEARKMEKVLSLNELKEAEERILRCIQEECLVPEIQLLANKLPVVRRDGLLCIKTRLLNKNDTELFRWPVILPKDHPLVKALVLDLHNAYGHPGIQFLLCKLREKYWILGGRRAVKAIIRQCLRCRRHDAKPFGVVPAALPKDRVTPNEVYQTTGVDLAGPVSLKDGSKAWIVLFTCAVYRCVNFDLVTSLSAEAFLGALERFINLYGRPLKFYSDNGTNFVGVVNLMKALDWKRLEKEFEVHAIKWTFNPPAAPWWGGWWERLVRSMKNQLRRILGKARLTYDELRTSLSTVQSTMNDRPLTVMTEDTGDLITLTPAMFLHPTRSARFPEGDSLSQTDLGKTYKKMRSVQRQLQQRFRSEYLAQLVQRGKEKKSPVPKVGDVVLIGSDDKKRFQWPIGIIVEIIPGRDKEVRVAKVRTAHDYLLRKKTDGKWKVVKVKKGHIWTRPLQRLYPLEISSSEDVQILTEARKDQEKVEKKVQDITGEEKVVKTRCGRIVKQPSRYDQWITGISGDVYDYEYRE